MNTRVTAAAVVYAALVLVFAASARWLSRVHITAPIAFVIAGAVIAAAVPSSTAGTAGDIKAVAEVTLALILFHDAAQVRPRQIDADRGLVLRLLLVGLPLTVVVGFLAARVVFPAMPVMVALLLAAVCGDRFEPCGARPGSSSAERREWLERWADHPGGAVRDRRGRR